MVKMSNPKNTATFTTGLHPVIICLGWTTTHTALSTQPLDPHQLYTPRTSHDKAVKEENMH